MPEKTDLQWALHVFGSERRQTRYKLFYNYYMGNHALAFATEKFRNTFGNVFKEFAENMCATVVDSLSDRLEVVGFTSSEAEMKVENVASNTPTPQPPRPAALGPSLPTPKAQPRKKVTQEDPQGQAALDIWKRNNMDERAAEVHNESLMMGDAYAIVWPN